MNEPLTALAGFAVVKSVAWVGLKAIDLCAQTAADGGVQYRLNQIRKRAAAWLRGTGVKYGVLGDNPRATATNHDLLRALRAAWIRVAQQKVRSVRELQRAFKGTAEFRDWPGIALLADSLAEELRHLEMEAMDRSKPFLTASPVEERLLTIVKAVPEQVQGRSGEMDADTLTPAFVDGILALPVDWGGLRSRIEGILAEKLTIPSQGRILPPGEAILDQFVENLKSGQFPEAAKAFQFLVGGLIRQDVAEMADQLGGEMAAMRELIGDLRSELADGTDLATLSGLEAEIRRSNVEIADGLASLHRDFAQLEAVVGARDHDFIVTRDEVTERHRRLTTAFHGRHEELDWLFGRFQPRNSLTVVTAPAGTGKSGFMARAVDIAKGRGFAVASHFISREHQRTFEPDDALGFIALQLRALGDGAPDKRRLDRDIKSLQDEVYRRLQVDHLPARPLVMFVDGLDELDGRLPFFMPGERLGANVHVVVSCRTGDEDDVPPLLRDWVGQNAAQVVGLQPDELRLPLPPLNRPSITLWLKAVLGNISLMDAMPLVDRLEAASDGLAVFLRYLIADVRDAIRRGRTPGQVQRDLADLPASFAEYLRDCMPLYGPSERRFLALLAVAYGPVAQSELRALCSDIDVRNPPDLVRRWLAPATLFEGDGWTLQHPRLAAPFVEALDYEAEDARDTLTDHCRRAISDMPARGGSYAARWGSRHLLAHSDPSSIERLAGCFADPSFLAWRLGAAPTRQTLGLIQDDYDALLQAIDGTTYRDVGRWARIFASVVPVLSREAQQ